MSAVGGGLFRTTSTLGLGIGKQLSVKGLVFDESSWPKDVPQWDPVSAYADCFQCHDRKHKHNCRLCGHLFCRNCCSKIDGVPVRFRLKLKKGRVRVCIKCIGNLVSTVRQQSRRALIADSSGFTLTPRSMAREGSIKAGGEAISRSPTPSLSPCSSLSSTSVEPNPPVEPGTPMVVVTRPSIVENKDPSTSEIKRRPLTSTKITSMLGENMFMFAYLDRSGQPPPMRFDDLKADSCFLCKAKSTFSLTQFLNHCRLCGHLYCARCLDKFNIPRKYLSAQDADGTGRVCYGCEVKCRLGADMDVCPNIKAPRLMAEPTIQDLVITIPKWANLALYKSCTKCAKESRQGHNCRLCGFLFCDKCTTKMNVPEGYDKKNKQGEVRVCDRCRFLVLAGAELNTTVAPAETETAAMLGELGHMAEELSREFLDKLRKAACVGCDANFHMFNKRHQCPYCRLSWCNRCYAPHLLREAKESSKKELAAKKKTPMKKPTGDFLMPGVVLDSREVPAAMLGSAPAEDDSTSKATASSEAQAEGKEGHGFEILCRLGEGSYGAVYKATDKRDGKLVALKLIEDQAENLEALMKEIAFLDGCKHDHIVAYKGTFQLRDKTCIAMEYCCGGSLNDIMEVCDRTFEEKEIAVIMREALIGLHYLHSTNKIHRDVKSGNILINELGECKLADFGVSCEVTGKEERRKTIIGTPYWMAPEVLQAKEKSGYDCKSDIWSLGITAMELAKGVPPHSDMHPMRVIFKIPYVSSPKLPDPDNWSQDFMDFIAACLIKDYNTRPTAEELLKHKFITGAGSLSLLADLVAKSMAEIDQFRKQEAVEAKKDEDMLQTAKDNASETSESRTDQFDSARMYATTQLDDVVDPSSQLKEAVESYEGPESPGKKPAKEKKKEVTVYATTQLCVDITPDKNSYLGGFGPVPQPSPKHRDLQHLAGPRKTLTISELRQFGTMLLDVKTETVAQDSYLAQVQSAAKARYEAEEAATVAATSSQCVSTPGDWQVIRDPAGRITYHNAKNNTVTSDPPKDFGGAAASDIALAVSMLSKSGSSGGCESFPIVIISE